MNNTHTQEREQEQQQNNRPCSPPAAEQAAKAKFQADREEWLAQRRAGGGIQATVVSATGGFCAAGRSEISQMSAAMPCLFCLLTCMHVSCMFH